MFWRAWKLFSLLTGLSMDYYTPIEHRTHSFKEFMEEFINKQFIDQFRDFEDRGDRFRALVTSLPGRRVILDPAESAA